MENNRTHTVTPVKSNTKSKIKHQTHTRTVKKTMLVETLIYLHLALVCLLINR